MFVAREYCLLNVRNPIKVIEELEIICIFYYAAALNYILKDIVLQHLLILYISEFNERVE
jgi:hypothetical protein